MMRNLNIFPKVFETETTYSNRNVFVAVDLSESSREFGKLVTCQMSFESSTANSNSSAVYSNPDLWCSIRCMQSPIQHQLCSVHVVCRRNPIQLERGFLFRRVSRCNPSNMPPIVCLFCSYTLCIESESLLHDNLDDIWSDYRGVSVIDPVPNWDSADWGVRWIDWFVIAVDEWSRHWIYCCGMNLEIWLVGNL